MDRHRISCQIRSLHFQRFGRQSVFSKTMPSVGSAHVRIQAEHVGRRGCDPDTAIAVVDEKMHVPESVRIHEKTVAVRPIGYAGSKIGLVGSRDSLSCREFRRFTGTVSAKPSPRSQMRRMYRRSSPPRILRLPRIPFHSQEHRAHRQSNPASQPRVSSSAESYSGYRIPPPI